MPLIICDGVLTHRPFVYASCHMRCAVCVIVSANGKILARICQATCNTHLRHKNSANRIQKNKKKTMFCWAWKLPTLDHISFKQFQHVATWSTDRVTTCRYSHFILHPLHHGSLCCNRVAALKLRHRGDSLLNQQDLILVARAVLQSVRHQPGTFRGPTLTLSKLMAFRNTWGTMAPHPSTL